MLFNNDGAFNHHVDSNEIEGLSVDPIMSTKASTMNEKMIMFGEMGESRHYSKLPFQVPLPPPNDPVSTSGNLHFESPLVAYILSHQAL